MVSVVDYEKSVSTGDGDMKETGVALSSHVYCITDSSRSPLQKRVCTLIKSRRRLAVTCLKRCETGILTGGNFLKIGGKDNTTAPTVR